MDDSILFDPLAKYNNTRVLYKEIKKYMLVNNINRDSTKEEVEKRVTFCMRLMIRRHKPKVKVEYLLIKYLDSIDFFDKD